MTEQRVKYLLALHLRKECTSEEKDELFRWIHDCTDRDVLGRMLTDAWEDFVPEDALGSDRTQQMLSQILMKEEPVVMSDPALHETALETPVVGSAGNSIRRIGRRWVAAAAVLIIGGAFGYYTLKVAWPASRQMPLTAQRESALQDVLPGTTKATLTLGDGSAILLDTVSSGAFASQGNARIIKKNGRVVYQANATTASGLIYNTLSTTRGHQYPLTLSDGSRIWLNAASSIRFPVLFSGKERSVDITGEVYFEVAKSIKPFIVNAGIAKVEVLGTHFNINAYSDEDQLNTTLLEGSVKVVQGGSALQLARGQQARIRKNGSIELNRNADMEEAVSWTQGYFHFSDAGLKTILRQLSRWYDVDVIFEKQTAGETFSGDIQKSLSLSQVLKILDKNQVRFQINGKRLIVLN